MNDMDVMASVRTCSRSDTRHCSIFHQTYSVVVTFEGFSQRLVSYADFKEELSSIGELCQRRVYLLRVGLHRMLLRPVHPLGIQQRGCNALTCHNVDHGGGSRRHNRDFGLAWRSSDPCLIDGYGITLKIAEIGVSTLLVRIGVVTVHLVKMM
jgi:hypothetical protein